MKKAESVVTITVTLQTLNIKIKRILFFAPDVSKFKAARL